MHTKFGENEGFYYTGAMCWPQQLLVFQAPCITWIAMYATSELLVFSSNNNHITKFRVYMIQLNFENGSFHILTFCYLI